MNKRSTLLAAALLFLVAAGALSAAPVKLLYAKTSYAWDGSYAFGYVEVENIAFAKNVTVHYRVGSGAWTNATAAYVNATQGNFEAWTFNTVATKLGYKQSAVIEFAIKYEVAGQTYWDNNGGANYKVEIGYSPILPCVLLQQSYVVLDWASGMLYTENGQVTRKQFYGSVYVKNLGWANRAVRIVYSTDGWQTVKTADAAYARVYYGNVECFSFQFDVPVDTVRMNYAIEYVHDGQSSWDNNFRKDYVYSYN